MEDSNAAPFVDRKETMLGIQQPRQMNALKTEITAADGMENSLESGTEFSAQRSSQEARTTVCDMSQSSEKSAEDMSLPSSLPFKISEASSLITMAPAGSSSWTLPEAETHIFGQAGNSHTFTGQMTSLSMKNKFQEWEVQAMSSGEPLWSETGDTRQPEEEKEASEYCPGLAIRSLALEDFMDKRTDPTSTPSGSEIKSATLSQEPQTSQIMSQSIASTALSANPGQNTPHAHGKSASLKKPLFDPIEVERKFTITADTEEKLKTLGARLHREKVFTDVYYDNDDYALILSDCWLRRRNSTWEAKVPTTPEKAHAFSAPSTQYKEIREEREISTWLVQQLKLDRWLRGDPLDLLVHAAGLTPFATFSTTRRTYHLPPCVVDLDLTDHGFRVGEIEVMAASPEEVPQALQAINGVAQQLGLTPLLLT